MRHLFANPWFLTLLGLLPTLGLLAFWARRRRAVALAKFGNSATLGPLLQGKRRRRRVRGLCWLLSLLLLGVASAGPQWGKEWDTTATGRDLIIVLDCSGSMLAENPCRLSRARVALHDLCQELQKRGGHRVGLVVFAGKPRLACPLTHDYDYFRYTLGVTEKDTLALPFAPELRPGPHDRSGTRIGSGLIEALKARDPRYPGGCDIILLSDGDDPARDDEWQQGAEAARDAGTPIHTIGIGNPDPSEEEAKIYIGKEPLKDSDGNPVRTRLQEGPLRQIAQISHGTYTAMHTRRLALGRFYLDLIADKPTRENTDDPLPVYPSRHLWFLTPAFVLLCLAIALPDRGTRATPPPLEETPP